MKWKVFVVEYHCILSILVISARKWELIIHISKNYKQVELFFRTSNWENKNTSQYLVNKLIYSSSQSPNKMKEELEFYWL